MEAAFNWNTETRTPNLVFLSDTHPYKSLPGIIEALPFQIYRSLGDLNAWTDAPHGRGRHSWENDVVYTIQREQGVGKWEAIDIAMRDHPIEFFEQLIAEAIYTNLSVRHLDQLFDQGVIPSRIPETSGNSNESYSGILEMLSNKYGVRAPTAEDYLKGSKALRRQTAVEYETIGDTLVVTLPYVENGHSWVSFENRLDDIVAEIRRSQPSHVVVGTHEHVDPGTVLNISDPRKPLMYDIVMKYLDTIAAASDADVSFIAGHVHTFAEPYQLENGVTVYTIGWKEGTGQMRVLVMDPETGKMEYKDIDIEVSAEELLFLENLVEAEIERHGYRETIEAKQSEYGTEEEGASKSEAEGEEAESTESEAA